MTRWREEPKSLAPVVPAVTVETLLLERLGTLREALIAEALDLGWQPQAVDRILRSAGLEEMTREYAVAYSETTRQEVRVRAVSPAAASEEAGLYGDQRLEGVREVRPT